MFLGMAFFKNGVITGTKRIRTYWGMFLIGLGFGLPLSYLRIHPDMTTYNFSHYLHIKHTSIDFYPISRTFRTIGILVQSWSCTVRVVQMVLQPDATCRANGFH
jgi:uncharacterized protein